MRASKAMKVRYLGHSCVEIIGAHHIIIDPDFTRNPAGKIDYILVSHSHRDHIARIGDLSSGRVIASEDVCEAAFNLGVSKDRLQPVKPGDYIENIKILPGFSMVEGLVYKLVYFLYRGRFPDPGGTPLSFLVEDIVSILHIGDAHKFELDISPDILCIPWRKTPIGPKKYKKQIEKMIRKISPKFIMPIHYDIQGMEADPAELSRILNRNLLLGNDWHIFNDGD